MYSPIRSPSSTPAWGFNEMGAFCLSRIYHTFQLDKFSCLLMLEVGPASKWSNICGPPQRDLSGSKWSKCPLSLFAPYVLAKTWGNSCMRKCLMILVLRNSCMSSGSAIHQQYISIVSITKSNHLSKFLKRKFKKLKKKYPNRISNSKQVCLSRNNDI